MKLMHILFLCCILNTHGQKDTIYGVATDYISDNKVESYVYRNLKKIVLKKQYGINKKCSHFSLKYDSCYYLKLSKKEGLIYESKNGVRFSGIAEEGNDKFRIITHVSQGIPYKEYRYDSINKVKKYYKIKLGNIERGFVDRSIIKKPYYEYYSNGNIKIKSQKKNSKYYGCYREYHKNGKLKVKGKYNEEGKKIGNWKYYNIQGKLIGNDTVAYEKDTIIKSKNKELLKHKITTHSIKKQLDGVTTTFLNAKEASIFRNRDNNNLYGFYNLIKKHKKGKRKLRVGSMVVYDSINPYLYKKNTDEFVEIFLKDSGIVLYDGKIKIGMKLSKLVEEFGSNYMKKEDKIIYRHKNKIAIFKVKDGIIKKIRIGIYRVGVEINSIVNGW